MPMTATYRSVLFVAAGLSALALVAAGCGGGGGGSLPAVSVGTLATLSVDQANHRVTGVVVEVTTPGDTISLTNPTARLVPPVGAPTALTVQVSADHRRVTVGAAELPSPGVYQLEITQPVQITDAQTSTTCSIGRLIIRCQVTGSGRIVLPSTVTVRIPTRGPLSTSQRSAVMTGLVTNDWARVVIVDHEGGTSTASDQADGTGRCTIANAQGSITGELLSGTDTRITIAFAENSGSL